MTDCTITLKSGHRLCYTEFGDPLGVPTFYFHGWPCSRLHAWTMHEAAKQNGIRLVCADRPGLGQSDYQPERQLLDWPPVVEELADHLGWDKFHIIGVSGGGPYALACSLTIPHRLYSSQVVCGAPPIHELGSGDLFWVYRALIRLRKISPLILSAVLSLGSTLAARDHQDFPMRNLVGMLAPSDRASLREPGHFLAIAGSFRLAVENGTSSLIADADIYLNPWRFSLSAIQFPVHFWHGKEDRNISWRYAEKIANQIPNASVRWFENEGHYSLPVNQADGIFGQIHRTHDSGDSSAWQAEKVA